MKIICTYNRNFKNYIFETLINFGCKLIKEFSETASIVNIDKSFNDFYKKIISSKIIFLHHIQPVNFEFYVTNNFIEDIKNLIVKNINNFFNKNKTYSIQIRTIECRFNKCDIILNIEKCVDLKKNNKNPEQVISIFIHKNRCFVGFSETKFNLSKWNGGEVRYNYHDCISRAEFKLMELLDFISTKKCNYKTALDLGCAPGGWSRVLLDRNLIVTGIDPAEVDKRLLVNKNFIYHKMVSEDFKKLNNNNFDIIVNDMKINYKSSIKIIKSFLKDLNKNGIVIMTIKLFKNEDVKEAINIVKNNFQNLVLIKQLYHNRNEFTVVLK